MSALPSIDSNDGKLELPGRKSAMRLEPLGDGRHRITVLPYPGQTAARRSWVTSYPVELVLRIFATKDLNVCDEIMREEDPRYVEHKLRTEVLSYLSPEAFAGKRILDFGCGSGASPLVLARLLPPCEIVGVELEEKLLELARLRAQHFGRTSLQLLQSPSGDSLPPDLGEFDFIMFNAVFEHLLPHERHTLLPLVWRHLRPGGVMFLNQTPYRWSPVEVHTTQGMPLINYLPDSMTLWAARRYCKRIAPDESWESLLRRGIRGGTVPEILGILGGPTHAQLLRPLPEVGDRVDLWYKTLSSKHDWLKRSLWMSLKAGKALSGREITPTLSLAIRKVGDPAPRS
ncbi:MAG TPA: methyltransferase domain-containing protein [Steroidobacteraceae bacterium]|jgi:2-polyprenyl-3-methyl-5-hydroxy-6-metoxy-1,4-benzoquinol methylase|nr:methyltransferase domain-containing protein [Steroidobacteraceae bacterium]